MRPSGIYMLHLSRVIPTDTGYSALIDGVDHGSLMAWSMETAVTEIKQMIRQMIKDGQK